jgi:hypothetical protein
MLLSIPLRHQQLDRLPQEFIAGESKEFLGLSVNQDDPAFGVDHQHSVGGRFHGEPKFLFGPLSLGNVDDGA